MRVIQCEPIASREKAAYACEDCMNDSSLLDMRELAGKRNAMHLQPAVSHPAPWDARAEELGSGGENLGHVAA